jgi:cellulose synthase/poly-beta-1,6-N-acetylglucosamine synthase-like glycosyltransferase
LYTYLGYPFLLTLLALTRPRLRPWSPVTPSVTLLIAAYNEHAVLAEKLANSLRLDYPRERLQILVAADGSDDGTPEMLRGYSADGIELSYRPQRQGKMAAINHAMQQAHGEIIVFSDANNLYNPNALRLLVAPFADPTVGAVSGAKRIVRGDSPLGDAECFYWQYEAFIKGQETRLGCCTAVVGEMFAIRRHLFDYPPEQVINDDFYMAMRCIQRGYRVVYAAQASSMERISLSSRDEITRRSRIVAGRYQALVLAPKLLPWRRPLLLWQVLSHKMLRPLVPLAMLGAVLSNLLAVVYPASAASSWLFLSPPVNWIVLLLQTCFYGLASLGGRVGGRVGKVLYLPTFLVNSNLAALLGLWRFLRRRHTPLWQRVPRPVPPP